MIKIEHPNIDKIVGKHYEACKQYIEPRVDFCIAFFNALAEIEYTSIQKSILDTFGIHGSAANSIVKPFFKEEELNAKRITEILGGDYKMKISNCSEKLSFFQYIKENLKLIITGTPKEISNIINANEKGKEETEHYKMKQDCLKKVFNYDAFVNGDLDDWNNYTLTEMLGISACPYCNRNWINTVQDVQNKKGTGKLTNPQLDHFFCKKEHPILRLSFYNLIPSCETCNVRLKGGEEFTYGKNLHPYEKGYGEEYIFETSPNNIDACLGLSNDYEVALRHIDGNEKEITVVNNHETFKIDTIYKEHGDLISEIYRKKALLGSSYINMLKTQLDIEEDEAYKFALGSYAEEADYKKRPFSKLTKDVATQIGLVKSTKNKDNKSLK